VIIHISLDIVRLKFVWLFLPFLLYFATPSSSSLVYAVGVGLVGLGVRFWAAGFINKFSELTTLGPYAHTRNPLYLGSLLIGLSFTIAAGQMLLVLVCLAFFCFVHIPKALREAIELENKFGDQYRDYAISVPLVVPQLTAYRSPFLVSSPVRFSFRRYWANREWEAFLGTALVFGLLFLRILQ
jgi:protein-S-isoprenylcysteine O-methyltransferase Ste14